MAEKIADYFGQLGFRVDDKGLKEFVAKLDALAKQMKGLTKAAGTTNAIQKVADGMKSIGDKAKVAGDAVDKAADKMVRANKKVTQAQIKEQQKLDKALSRGNASNPLTELQNRIKANTAKRAGMQGGASAAEQARLDAWFAAAAKKEQALMRSSSAAYRRSSLLGSRQVAGIVGGANRSVAARSAADAAELARYEAWFGKAESRDAALGIAGGKDYRRSVNAGQANIRSVMADIRAAKVQREKASAVRVDRDALRVQRRAETAAREDERRFQNRVSRTYSPTTSKLMRQQADFTKVQERYNTAVATGNKLEAERYRHAMKYLRSNIRDLNRERFEKNLGVFGRAGRAMGYGRGATGALAMLQPSLGMVAAGGAAGAGYFLTDAFRQTMDIQSYKQQFQALYGTEDSGKAGMQSYLDYSNKMGTNASKNMQEYLRFMFASKDTVGLDTGRGIYESFSVLAKTRGVKGDAYSRSLTSLSQMLSKGGLMSEEVKAQFSVCCPA